MVPGTVLYSEFLGSTTVRYGVRVGATEIAVDTPFQAGDGLHEIGDAVGVTLPLGAALWLAS